MLEYPWRQYEIMKNLVVGSMIVDYIS
jgi:hypothetical protein